MDRKLTPVEFLGDSLEVIGEWSVKARQLVGFEIMRLQNGDNPINWKPLTGFPTGTREIRVKVDTNIFRTVYVIRKAGKVCIVHAFQKKSQKMSKSDGELIRKRLKEI